MTGHTAIMNVTAVLSQFQQGVDSCKPREKPSRLPTPRGHLFHDYLAVSPYMHMAPSQAGSQSHDLADLGVWGCCRVNVLLDLPNERLHLPCNCVLWISTAKNSTVLQFSVNQCSAIEAFRRGLRQHISRPSTAA